MLFFKFRGMQRKNKARIPPGCETVLIKITRPLPSAAPGFSDRLYSLCAAIFSASSSARHFFACPLFSVLRRRKSCRGSSAAGGLFGLCQIPTRGHFFQKLRGEFSPNITAARQRPPALKLFKPPRPLCRPDRRGLRPIQRGAEHGRPFVRMICAALSLPVVGLLRGLRGSSRAAAAVAGFRERPRKGKPPAGAL
jgi:hypothetical protein